VKINPHGRDIESEGRSKRCEETSGDGARGRTYLVNVDGETDRGELRERVADRYEPFVRTLLG